MRRVLTTEVHDLQYRSSVKMVGCDAGLTKLVLGVAIGPGVDGRDAGCLILKDRVPGVDEELVISHLTSKKAKP